MKTFNGHAGGCKCDSCRTQRNAYHRHHNTIHRGPRSDSRRVTEILPVECWCGKAVVSATAAEIRAGITYPCDRDECKTLAKLNERAA